MKQMRCRPSAWEKNVTQVFLYLLKSIHIIKRNVEGKRGQDGGPGP